jgi:long-subunit fatty acid transport protein
MDLFMKKVIISILMCVVATVFGFAGGMVTNTNQGAAYLRKVSLNGTTDINAVYFNPAGLTKLKDGWHFSLSNQVIIQEFNVSSNFPTLNNMKDGERTYVGEVNVPFYPNFYAVWKKDKLAVSTAFNIVGGGGSATYDDGLPGFETQISMIPAALSSLQVPLGDGNVLTLPTSGYRADISFEGMSAYYAGQLGVSYEFSKNISGFIGSRIVYAANSYEGYIKNIMINPESAALNLDGSYINASQFFTHLSENPVVPAEMVPQVQYYANATSDKSVDAKQSGLGFTPIIGVNLSLMDEKLNIGGTYEFITKLELENNTNVDDVNMFPDGKKVKNDMPALFKIGAEYKVTNDFRVNLGLNYYFDSAVEREGREEYIDHGLFEMHGSLEYDISKKLMVSCGYSRGVTGVTPEYQTEMSYSLNSDTYGMGGAYKLNNMFTISAGLLYASYCDMDQETPANPSAQILSYKTNFDKETFMGGIGVDIHLNQ